MDSFNLELIEGHGWELITNTDGFICRECKKEVKPGDMLFSKHLNWFMHKECLMNRKIPVTTEFFNVVNLIKTGDKDQTSTSS